VVGLCVVVVDSAVVLAVVVVCNVVVISATVVVSPTHEVQRYKMHRKHTLLSYFPYPVHVKKFLGFFYFFHFLTF